MAPAKKICIIGAFPEPCWHCCHHYVLCRASGCWSHEHPFVTTSYTLQLSGFTPCFSQLEKFNGMEIPRSRTPALKMSQLVGVEHAALHFIHLALPLHEYEVNNFNSHQTAFQRVTNTNITILASNRLSITAPKISASFQESDWTLQFTPRLARLGQLLKTWGLWHQALLYPCAVVHHLPPTEFALCSLWTVLWHQSGTDSFPLMFLKTFLLSISTFPLEGCFIFAS